MFRLIKRELQRMNLRPYLISSAAIGVLLLVFTYFIAYVAQVEQEATFMTYGNIFLFTGLMGGLFFGILAATMYAKLIIEEYSGKRLALLFSYPVGRSRIFTAKVLIVLLFISFSMLVCTICPFFIFVVTESFAPIVSDTMTGAVLLRAFKTIAVSVFAVNAIGLLAMRIGFVKKSVSVTLISAFIMSAVYGNISAGNTGALSLLLTGISVMVMAVVYVTLSRKINHMEAE